MSTKVPFLKISQQYRQISKEILAEFKATMQRGSFVLGPNVQAFEREAAVFLGAKHAIAVNSGTDALLVSLMAAGIGPGDDVLVPSFTFYATAEAVSLTGARPVFCDIEDETFLMDLNDVKRKLTARTKAVIPVHLFGLCMDLRPLKKVLKGRKIVIIEDAAQSFGASCNGGNCGAMGDFGAFSFYPTKNLGAAGDAGLITTQSSAKAARARLVKDHGSKIRYHHECIGVNSRMDEFQAIVLRAKLPMVSKWNEKRQQIAEKYRKGLSDLPLQLPVASENSVWHQYTIRTLKRDQLQKHLSETGISTAVFYPGPIHLQKPFGKQKSLKVTEKAAKQVLCLPICPELNDLEIKTVINAIRSFWG